MQDAYPYFNLRFVQLQVVGQVLTAFLCEVAVLLELLLQPVQLVLRERGPWPFVLRGRFLLRTTLGAGGSAT